MANLGALYYTLGIKDLTDQDLQKIQSKLNNLGVKIDASTIRQQIISAIGTTPFDAKVSFNGARASLESIFLNKKYAANVDVNGFKLQDSIITALSKFTTTANILPKKKELRKAVTDALASSGFTINIDKITGLTATLNFALSKSHTLKLTVDPNKLADAIDKAAKSYKGGNIPVEVKQKVLVDSVKAALRSEKFPISVVIKKAEAQAAVREALQRAGLQGSGYSVSDKRASDAQARMLEAQARAAAANALAQQRMAAAHRASAAAARGNTAAHLTLNSALKGGINLSHDFGKNIYAAFATGALVQFSKKVVEIGGQLEQAKLAMKSILNDEGLANDISSKINSLAIRSPFGIMDLNQYAKQLTAFQIPYNELYDTMKRMADISAAVGVDMGRIILAYGQIRAATVLRGCLGKGTIIIMADGSTKKVENIVVGDMIMGDDNTPRCVLSLIRNREMMYTVDCGTSRFRCNENHILTAFNITTNDIEDVYVLNYLANPKNYMGIRRVNAHYEYFNMCITKDCYDDYFGFEIDGNKRFLIEDGVVTHNTELRQLTEANIPMLDMLAKRFSKLRGEVVSTGEVMDMISDKQVSFDDVKAVLWELTGEGGRFYNMQEVLSESTKAKWKNLADAIDLMFADVLSATSGPLKELAEFLTALTKSWRDVAMAVGGAVSVYKSAKIAIAATNKYVELQTLASKVNASKWDVLGGKIDHVIRRLRTFATSSAGKFSIGAGAITAALALMLELWQRQAAESSKAGDFGADMYTKAAEAARNLADAVKDLSDNTDSMKSTELESGIKRMQTLIKDYSSTPNEDIAKSLINEKNEVASLTEQYESLLNTVKEIAKAKKLAEDINFGELSTGAINSADSGWFDDNLLTDIDDYNDKIADQSSAIMRYANAYRSHLKNMVESARAADKEFAEATEGMQDYSAMFALLANNQQRFVDALADLDVKNGLMSAGLTEEETGVTGAEDELIKEWEQYLRNMQTSLNSKGVDVNVAGPLQRAFLDSIHEALSKVQGPAKTAMENTFAEIFGVNIKNDELQSSVIASFSDAFKDAAPTIANKLRYGETYTNLSEAEKEVVKKLVDDAAEETKKRFPDYADQLQNLLDDSNFTANIALRFASEQSASELQRMLWADNISTASREETNKFNLWSQSAKGVEDIKGNAVKEYKDLKKELDLAKKNTNTTEQYVAELQKRADLMKDVYRKAGFGDLDADAKDSKRSSGSTEDAIAKQLKHRLDVLKKAYSEYQKDLQTMSEDDALTNIKNSHIFDELFSGEDAIVDFSDYETQLQKLLDKAEASIAGMSENDKRFKGRHDLVISLRTLLNLEIPRDEEKRVAEQIKSQLDSIMNRISRDWNFYNALFEYTGDKGFSSKLAFGNTTAFRSEVEQMQAELEKAMQDSGVSVPLTISDEEAKEKLKGTNLFDYWKKTKEAVENEKINIQIDVAKAMYEMKSIEDKIKVQENRRTTAKDSFIKLFPDATDAEVNAFLKPYDDAINELKSTALELLPIWEQIFGDHQYQSYGEVKKAAKVANEIVKNAEVKKDENGKPVSFTSSYIGDNGETQQISGRISQLERLKKILDDLFQEGVKKNPFASLGESISNLFKKDDPNQEAESFAKKLAKVGEAAAECSDIIGDMAGKLGDMFDAMGNDSMATAMTDVQDAMNSVSNIGKGFAQGGVFGGVVAAAGEAVGWVTKLFQRHDANLQKQIERSQRAAQQMQNQYDALERRMSSFLGNAASMTTGVNGGAYGKQRQLMQQQLQELQKQRDLEERKKKTDENAIMEYDAQIDELTVQIQDFAQEAANSIYGIDLSGWAQQISDSLVTAFANGEDAAKAFDSTVGDIMRDITSKMISEDLIAPMFGDLKNYLFGANGTSGAFGSDFKLSASELGAVKDYLDKIRNEGIPAAEELYNAINEATNGLLEDTASAKDGLKAGIQGVTEDTAGLLASYVNSIRDYCAKIANGQIDATEQIRMIALEALPKMTSIAESQLRVQEQIAMNTLRTAIAVEQALAINTNIHDILSKNVKGINKFNI